MPQNNHATSSQVNPNVVETNETNNATTTTRSIIEQLGPSAISHEEYTFFNSIQPEAGQEINNNESEILRLLRISRHLRHRRARLIAFFIGPFEAIANIAASINQQGEIMVAYANHDPSIPEFKVKNAEEVEQRVNLQGSNPEKSLSNTLSSDLEKDLLLEKLIKDRIKVEGTATSSSQEIDVFDYKCPLTQCIFNQPVVASDGRRYELAALKEHFKTNAVFKPRDGEWVVLSPINRSKLQWEVRFDKEMHHWINETIMKENQRFQNHDHGLFTRPKSRKRQREIEDSADRNVSGAEKRKRANP